MKGISLSKSESVALEERRLFQLRRAVLSDEFPYGKVGDTLFVREWWWSCYDGLDSSHCCKTFAEKKLLRCSATFDAINPPSVMLMPPLTMKRSDAKNFIRIKSFRKQKNHLITERDFRWEGGRRSGDWFLGAKHPIKGTSKVFFTPYSAIYSRVCGRNSNIDKETFSEQESWLIEIEKRDSSSIIEEQREG